MRTLAATLLALAFSLGGCYAGQDTTEQPANACIAIGPGPPGRCSSTAPNTPTPKPVQPSTTPPPTQPRDCGGLRGVPPQDPPREAGFCQAVRFWRNHYHLAPDSMCDPVQNLLRRLDAGGISYEVRVEPGEQPRQIVTNLRRDGSPTKVIVWVGGSNPSCRDPKVVTHPDCLVPCLDTGDYLGKTVKQATVEAKRDGFGPIHVRFAGFTRQRCCKTSDWRPTDIVVEVRPDGVVARGKALDFCAVAPSQQRQIGTCWSD